MYELFNIYVAKVNIVETDKDRHGKTFKNVDHVRCNKKHKHSFVWMESCCRFN